VNVSLQLDQNFFSLFCQLTVLDDLLVVSHYRFVSFLHFSIGDMQPVISNPMGFKGQTDFRHVG
jgi:hypothetical protein